MREIDKLKYRANILTPGMIRMVTFFRKYPWVAMRMLANRNGSPVDLAEFQILCIVVAWKKLFPIFNLTRGAGKTFIQGHLAILVSLLYPRRQVGIISNSFRQAKMAFNEAEKTIKSSPMLQQAIFKGPTHRTDEYFLIWRHQAGFKALPLGDGGKIRGSRFHTVLIDEYAQVNKEVIDVVVIGFTATNVDPMAEVRRREREKILLEAGEEVREKGGRENQVCCFSTSYYQYNHLWDTLQKRLSYMKSKYTERPVSGNEDYAVLKLAYDILPDGFQNEKSLRMAKQTMSSHEFRMEYETYYPSDSDGFFRMSVVDGATSKKYSYRYYGDNVHEYFLGIDPARDNDNCAFVIIQVGTQNESDCVVCVETLNNKSYSIIHSKILELFDRYNVTKMEVDKGGGGSEIKDNLCDIDKMKSRPLVWDTEDPISWINGVQTNPRPGLHILKLFKSSPNLLSVANHSLLGSLERRSLVFAREPSDELMDSSSEEELVWFESQIVEFESIKKELSRIVVSITGRGVTHWDTENKHEKKDRYSALLVANNMLRELKEEKIEASDKHLIIGGWVDDLGYNNNTSQMDQYKDACL